MNWKQTMSANRQQSAFKRFLFIHTQLGALMLDQGPQSFADLKDLCKDNIDSQQYRLRYIKCCRDGFDFSEIHYEEIDVPNFINNSNTCEGFCTLFLKLLNWVWETNLLQVTQCEKSFPALSRSPSSPHDAPCAPGLSPSRTVPLWSNRSLES